MEHITIDRRSLLRFAGAGCALAASPFAFAADAYPSRPIRIVVPYAPGGGTDVVGRALAQAMSKELGQPIIIDNKAGGGTVIGSDLVSKSAADGYTLLMTTSAIAINASLVKNLPYDTEKGFAEVALICHGPNVLVVRADSPFKTLQDIIKAAKEKPGKLNYASSGNGSAVHLAAELLKNMAKIDLTHVPYRGAGPAYTDLLGGQVDMLFGTAGGVNKFVETGKMRAIAVTSKERSGAYKNVPAVAETVPGYEAITWFGLFTTNGTPAPVIGKINAEVQKVFADPAFRERYITPNLFETMTSSPEQFAEFIRTDSLKWAKVIRDANIRVD